MLGDGERISFATVARAAQVSTWLVYAEGVREHIEAAIKRQEQARVTDVAEGRGASPGGLQADLAMAREEIKELRRERDRLRQALRQQLGQQLDQISHRPLAERIAELTEANRMLEHEVHKLRPLANRVHELGRDLAAARTSLRQVIRHTNCP